MTANEPTPDDRENVTDSIDYERLGRETAIAELERHGSRIQRQISDAAGKIERDELTQEDVAEIQKELANTQVWVARIAEGRHLHAHEVLEQD
jgi:hypothetical protein